LCEDTITDPAGDVAPFDFLGMGEEFGSDVVTDHPDVEVDNVDLIGVKYTRSGTSVTVELRVEGKIEDRGEDFYSSDPWENPFGTFESISYGFDLIMLENDSSVVYQVGYTNESCTILYPSSFEQENLTDWSIENLDTLVINFELETENETYDSIQGTSMYLKMNLSIENIDDPDALEEAFSAIADFAPNPPLEVIFADTKNQIDKAVVDAAIEFEAIGFGGEVPYSYHWDFGDGSSSNDQNPTHAYTKAGSYTFNLTITDESETKAWDTGLIEIIAEDDGGGTPGFEFIIALAAIAMIFIFRRRYSSA
jgi:PKD repeat protein